MYLCLPVTLKECTYCGNYAMAPCARIQCTPCICIQTVQHANSRGRWQLCRQWVQRHQSTV